MTQFSNKELNCKDCGAAFTDRAQDQEFRFKKGWLDAEGNVTPMTRCYKCRQAKKAARMTGGDTYDRDNRSKGYR